MAFDFNKLNKEQQVAVYHTEGPVIVTAGAGTGKTRLLTNRIAYLIEQKGVAPENILAITFTNKATNEMRERILDNVEGGDRVVISTFHSLCVKILRHDIDKLDSTYNRFFTIYDDADQEKVIKKLVAEEQLDDDFKKVALYYISKAKNEGVSVEEFESAFPLFKDGKTIAEFYAKYEAYLKKNNALDFDDLIFKTILLFKKRPDVLSYYQNRFKYIHIDEFQDTNLTQYNLAHMLASSHKNILVVGDEDQSIYGWRGANYKNLFRFTEDFKGATLYKLEQNYRSSSKILEKANKLISNNTERFDKVLFTENEEGEEVELKVFDTDLQEADYVARQIKKEVALGASLSDFAVLYRINSVSRLFENAFVNNSIAYTVFGGLKFYSRAEIKNILAYLRLLTNPSDNEALSRIINFPKRGIGKATLDALENEANSNGVGMLSFILNCDKEFKNKGVEHFKALMKDLLLTYQTQDFVEVCTKTINSLNLNEVYASKSEEDLARLMNIKSLLVAVREFAESNPGATLTDFLENVSLSSDTEELTEGVVLGTVHAVKGLEFKKVFIVACEENMFPFAKSIEEGTVEEERRLMYVAITRAEEKLTITCAKRRFSFGGGFDSYSLKSRFLKEIGLKDINEQSARAISSNTYFSSNYSEKHTNSGPSFSQSANDFLKGLAQVHKASDYYSQPKNDLTKVSVGTKVAHVRYGEGKIVSLNGSLAEIEFESGVKKELNLEFALIEILED